MLARNSAAGRALTGTTTHQEPRQGTARGAAHLCLSCMEIALMKTFPRFFAVALFAALCTALAPHALLAQQQPPPFQDTGDLNTARYVHTMTLLADGRMLVAGGYNAID